jgi:hypothetical protein
MAFEGIKVRSSGHVVMNHGSDPERWTGPCPQKAKPKAFPLQSKLSFYEDTLVMKARWLSTAEQN